MKICHYMKPFPILSLAGSFLIPSTALSNIIINNANVTYVLDGVFSSNFGKGIDGTYIQIDKINSYRLYDSDKGGPWTSNNNDSLMCWTHAASNSIQYWQDVYGVFYKDKGNIAASGSSSPRVLPNGHYNTTLTPDYTTKIDGEYATIEINNPGALNIAKAFFDNWDNSGGKFSNAADWYFKWDYTTSPSPGGYYSEYFGNGNSSRNSYVTVYSTYAENTNNPNTWGTSEGFTPFNDTIDSLTKVLLPAFGFEKNADGTYTQSQEGMMPFIGIWNKDKGTGHMLSCQGFTTDENGNLVSLLLADGDDNGTSLKEAYLKEDDGVIKLYNNKNCTTLFYSTLNYYIGEVSYINTPEVLRNMLSEYRDTKEAAVWNGSATTWETQVDVVDSNIADSSTGWDILVNGDNIDEAHHGYYHGYALADRDIEFGDHAESSNRQVTIQGTVSARNIEVTAAGYQFLKGTDADITVATEASSLNIRSGASLSSELAFHGRSLLIENGASLTLSNVNELRLTDVSLHSGSSIEATINSTIYVTGAFNTTQGTSVASLYSLRSAIIPEASVNANLDLSEATSISLECMVNMNGFDLFLNSQTPITLNLLEGDDSIPLFTNIGALYLDNALLSNGTDLTEVLTLTNWDNFTNYNLIYSDGTLGLVIPEPTTSSLSLLGLALLLIRRKRQ